LLRCTVFTDVVESGIIAWNNPFVGWAEVCEDGMTLWTDAVHDAGIAVAM
jgi:hypothetical protein